jgi:DNA-binding transcriptional MerR regulator
MPTDNEYSLADLADLVGVTPRTVRYYVAQGLVPSPGQGGPGARYTDGHLNRLRLIRRLQREHLPLAEIRTRLEPLDDDEIADLLGAEPVAPTEGSAIDYIRSVLAKPAGTEWGEPTVSPMPRMASMHFMREVSSSEPWPEPAPPPPKPPPQGTPDRSQWDRIAFTPDVELHVRRPLSRLQNKQVDRLIAIARELLEGDPS